MTHSGGKPHAVGDKGQQYEIRATGYPKDEECVIGWTTDLDQAKAMATSILLAPSCKSASVLDRFNLNTVLFECEVKIS